MASIEQVKRYLAYWFQAGKPLISPRHNQRILPQSILAGDHYSPEFESCFRTLLLPPYRDSYLEGTVQTLNELLSSRWELIDCSRCSMPIPIDELGLVTGCSCADLPAWPNTEIPQPRCPNTVQEQLKFIHERLKRHLTESL